MEALYYSMLCNAPIPSRKQERRSARRLTQVWRVSGRDPIPCKVPSLAVILFSRMNVKTSHNTAIDDNSTERLDSGLA